MLDLSLDTSSPSSGVVHEIDTHRTEFPIVLDGPQSLSLGMVMRGRSGMQICGATHVPEAAALAGVPCGCPLTWGERRALSRAGRGPKPAIAVRFRLVEEPALGNFDLLSSSWALMEDAHVVAPALGTKGSPTTAVLRVDQLAVTTADGVEVIGRRPSIQLSRR
ncbi:hypothetical protein [Kitasatospora purpeofusca]|uniref:hypothetical protein n=1 Tax=Kitasatospora purpeofusca TaxID=67352 RepID=UPI003648D568